MERLVIIDRVPQDIHCYASPSDTLRHALFEGKQRLSRKFDPLIKIDCRNDAKTNELLASEVTGTSSEPERMLAVAARRAGRKP